MGSVGVDDDFHAERAARYEIREQRFPARVLRRSRDFDPHLDLLFAAFPGVGNGGGGFAGDGPAGEGGRDRAFAATPQNGNDRQRNGGPGGASLHFHSFIVGAGRPISVQYG